ncbi:CehA/McbA family metallohydrolase [Candidatus Poribacteria bacterium]|nr:CehA/McbA family metallohydrolase [Candidatus Poribacteria bacterium]
MEYTKQCRTIGWLKKRAGSPLYWIFIAGLLTLTLSSVGSAEELKLDSPVGSAEELKLVAGVEFQPLASATKRLIEALDYLGAPLAAKDQIAIEAALISTDHEQAIADIQKILDPYCLIEVNISHESRVKVKEGEAKKELMQSGWRTFLVKVHNEAGVTAPPVTESSNAAPLYKRSRGSAEPPITVPESEILHRFLDIAMYSKPPLKKDLSGLELEYRIIQLYSRDAGRREALLAFNVGQGTQDIGFRNEVPILFHCVPAVKVTLEVLDFDGKPTTASFTIRDKFGRVYPSRGKRLAPDFFFHSQIYRHSGESVLLPPGEYTVEYTRGPEYRVESRTITIPEAESHKETFRLKRWIHVAAEGWRSGDHHVHAAGCSHYESPTEGVMPEDMMRHILGEDLNVGCILSWGPCWYFQKQFFDGKVHELSTDNYVMRYDVEVSGFPSSHAGHLSLLRLTEDDYRGVQRIEEWPSWDLPVLQWAKEQGAVTGFSHSGWGLKVAGDELPNYNMPPFDGIGANEYIVDVVHDAVDFISTVDTPAIWELNIWYHTLNCGFRTRISGETDFPCIYGDRVGLGRVYVKSADGPLDYDNWVMGLRDGRSYVGDGKSHLLNFTVGDVAVGEKGPTGEISQLDLEQPAKVNISVRVAALLDETPQPEIKNRPLDRKPYWDIERARIDDSRKVPVELIVNGKAVDRREIMADGEIVSVQFETAIERSSWVALRIFPSSHTNPVFVNVENEPIRASRKSAEWCLEAVEVCWNKKVQRIRESDQVAARKAYDVAKETYQKILEESDVD